MTELTDDSRLKMYGKHKSLKISLLNMYNNLNNAIAKVKALDSQLLADSNSLADFERRHTAKIIVGDFLNALDMKKHEKDKKDLVNKVKQITVALEKALSHYENLRDKSLRAIEAYSREVNNG